MVLKKHSTFQTVENLCCLQGKMLRIIAGILRLNTPADINLGNTLVYSGDFFPPLKMNTVRKFPLMISLLAIKFPMSLIGIINSVYINYRNTV